MSNDWGFGTLWNILGGGALALILREIFSYLLGKKRIDHSAEMEKTEAERRAEQEKIEAERQAKKEDYTGTLQEWRNYAKDRDRRIKQLEDRIQRYEDEARDTRNEVHTLTYQNLILQTRQTLYEQALMAAKIPIPHFEVEAPPELERVIVTRESLNND